MTNSNDNWICPHCETENTHADKYCVVCGMVPNAFDIAVNEDDEPNWNRSKVKKKNKKSGLSRDTAGKRGTKGNVVSYMSSQTIVNGKVTSSVKVISYSNGNIHISSKTKANGKSNIKITGDLSNVEVIANSKKDK